MIGTTGKNSGFTLLEVIVSIAALSFISVFILQMFISSSNLNNRAKDSDIAMSVAISEIESLKKHSAVSGYLSEGDDIRETTENNGVITVSLYYDKAWNLTKNSETVSPEAKPAYCLKVDIMPDTETPPQIEGVTSGVLYILNADVADISLTGNGRRLASFRTKKYFPKGYGEGI